MKRLVLALLFLCIPNSVSYGMEYSDIADDFLSDVEMKDQEQHERIKRALLSLQGLDQDDMEIIMGYICMSLGIAAVDDCDCECCCEQDMDNAVSDHCEEFDRS